MNVLLISVFSYFPSGQHLDDDQFNWARFALYTLFVWLMCVYYQAIGQLVGSLLIDHQIIANITTILVYSMFSMFDGLFMKLHRTADIFFYKISENLGMIYAIRGIYYAIFVFERCQEEGQFSEVAIDFHIEVEKLNIYVLRVLINVLVVKSLTLLVLHIKFNDWKKKIPKETICKDLLLQDAETKPSNDVTIKCNSIVSEKAALFQNKILIAWQRSMQNR